MKTYVRSELYRQLNDCDVAKICTEVYDALDLTGRDPMRSGDKFIMRVLKNKIAACNKNKMHASIVIIHKDIPVLVIHKGKVKIDSETQSINEIHIPFQGERVDSVLYKIIDMHEILDLLSEDDYKPGIKIGKYNKLSFI